MRNFVRIADNMTAGRQAAGVVLARLCTIRLSSDRRLA